MRKRILALALVFVMSLTPLSASEDDDSWLTRSGYYRVSFDSALDPIVINTIHAWVFHIQNPDGSPVTGATISVTGGMPLHNHGLPTDPQMTREIGNGDYLVEGVRFHMNGYWELLVTVDVDGKRDTVIVPLDI